MKYKDKFAEIQLSDNFSLEEFRCRCRHCDVILVSDELVTTLQALRNLLGEPIKVHSGYRCEYHNRKVGGVAKSQHLLGTAADISSKHHTPREIADAAEGLFNGLGRYRGFTHVDVRQHRTRWGNN